MSEEMFSTDMPDLQSLIKKLDMFDDKQNESLRGALHKVGQNIKQAQRRKIRRIKGGDKLAEAIDTSRVYATKKGVLGINSGYQSSAFKTDGKGFNPGVVGVTNEFGRPGKSPQRKGEYMSQNRKGKRVKIKKGTIQPTPHIRPGFDETLEQNVQLVADAVNKVIEGLGK